MSTGDNNITLTIQAVDASGPAIQQFTTRVVGAANSATEATNRYKSALEQLGPAAAAGNSQAAGIIAQYRAEAEQATAATRAAGAAGAAAGDQIRTGMGGAYGQMRLVSGLGREMGLNIDYGLRRVLTTIPGVTSGLTALLPIFGAIGVVALFAPLVEGAYHFVEGISDVNKEMDAFIEKAQEAAQQKLIDSGSIETTTAALDQIGKQLDELSAKQAHWKEQWRIDGTNITLPGAGFFQHIIPTSDIWDRYDDQRSAQLAQMQKEGQQHQRDLVHEQNVAQIDLTHAGDAVLGTQAKITAEKEKQLALDEEQRRYQQENADAYAKTAGVQPRQGVGTDTQAAKDWIAIVKARADATLDARREAEEVIKLDAQARNAQLGGISLLRAQEEEAIVDITRKYRENGQSRQAIDHATADLRAKYDADIQRSLDEQAQKIAQLRHEAESAGLSGIANIQSDRSYQLAQIDSPSVLRDTSPEAAAGREQERVLANQKADADILAERKRFSDEVAEIVQRSSSQELTGYAKIAAEEQRQLTDLTKAFKKSYGSLDFFDPTNQAVAVQGELQRNAASQAIQQNAARERLKYTEEADRQIAQTEAEAARSLLPPWQAAQQKIIDDYDQRVQKIREDEAQQTAAVAQNSAERVLIEDQANRQIAASLQLAESQMLHEIQQQRDQLAGQLQSFFDNPAKYMEQRAKRLGFEFIANIIQGAEQNNGRLSGFINGLFGENRLGTSSSPREAFGQLFGAHNSAPEGLLAVAGNALTSSGSVLYQAGTVQLEAAEALLRISGTAGGPSGVGAAGIQNRSGGGFSGESLGLPTSGEGPGFFSGDLGGTIPGATGGIGAAASAAGGIAGAAGAGGISSTITQGLQLSSLLHNAFSTPGSAPLLNPGGFQPSDIPPTNDAGVPGTVPGTGGAGSGAGSIGLAGGALTAITGGLALYGGLSAAYSAPTFASGLAGAGSTALTGAGIGTAFAPGVGACHIGEIEHLVGDIERNMGHAVTEGADPDHAAHVDELAEAGDPPQRADRKRQQQEHQHPKTGAVDQVIDRAGFEPDLGLPGHDRERDRPEQERKRGNAKHGQAPATVPPELDR